MILYAYHYYVSRWDAATVCGPAWEAEVSPSLGNGVNAGASCHCTCTAATSGDIEALLETLRNEPSTVSTESDCCARAVAAVADPMTALSTDAAWYGGVMPQQVLLPLMTFLPLQLCPTMVKID